MLTEVTEANAARDHAEVHNDYFQYEERTPPDTPPTPIRARLRSAHGAKAHRTE